MTQAYTVIGGGVMGLCVATELMRRGAEVCVIDHEPQPGPHACSWWAGGMLAPFCESETAEEPVVRLGQEAATWWQAQGVAVTQHGSLVLALGRDQSDLDRFARRTEHHRTLDRAAIDLLEPDLDGRFARGLHFDTEAHLAPRAALGVLRERLQAGGVYLIKSRTKRPGITFDCRGFAARDTLTDLRGVKGEMAILQCSEINLRRPVRLLHPRIPLYIVPRGDGIYMLGATQIEVSERNRATVRSVLELLTAAYALHPAFGEAELVEIGVDARPAFPDNLPRIRRRGDTIYMNGLFRHGFLLAPAMARMAADLVCKGIVPEVMDEDLGER